MASHLSLERVTPNFKCASLIFSPRYRPPPLPSAFGFCAPEGVGKRKEAWSYMGVMRGGGEFSNPSPFCLCCGARGELLPILGCRQGGGGFHLIMLKTLLFPHKKQHLEKVHRYLKNAAQLKEEAAPTNCVKYFRIDISSVSAPPAKLVRQTKSIEYYQIV